MIVGLCNPLLDISAAAEPAFLEKYGLKPNDAILAEEKHKPLYKELVSQYKVDYIAGGSGQNAMRVAQRVMQKPNVSIFMGCVGKDEFSTILETKARNDGVDVRYQYTDAESTGFYVIFSFFFFNISQFDICSKNLDLEVINIFPLTSFFFVALNQEHVLCCCLTMEHTDLCVPI